MVHVSSTDKTVDSAHPSRLSTHNREHSVLIENISTARYSLAPLNRQPTSNLARRVWGWLSDNIKRATKQTTPEEVALQQVCSRGRAIRQVAEGLYEQNLQQHSPGECQLSPSSWALLISTGAVLMSTVGGAFAYYRWRTCPENSMPVGNGTIPGNTGEMSSFGAFGRPFPMAEASIESKNGYKPHHKRKTANDINGVDNSEKKKCAQYFSGSKEGNYKKKDAACADKPFTYQFTNTQPLPVCNSPETKIKCEQAAMGNLPARQVIADDGDSCLCPPPTPFLSTSKTATAEVATITIPTTPKDTIIIRKRGGMAFLPPNEKGKSGHNPAQATSTTEPPADEVIIRRLFNTDCMEVRNNMGFSDWVMAAGDALKSPIKALGKEIQILHSHNQGEGCPPAESMQELDKYTEAFDAVVYSILGLIPHMRIVNILQSLIGPAMTMIAKEMKGIPTNISEFVNLNDQIISLLRPTIPTLTADEQFSLYRERPVDKDIAGATENSILTRRYSYKNGMPVIKIDEDSKYYPLHETSAGAPYIFDDEDRFRHVYFEANDGWWELINEKNNQLYSKDNIENTEKYGIHIPILHKDATMEPNNIDFLTIKQPGKPDLYGVFVRDKFIPAGYDVIQNQFVATTASPEYMEKRVLTYTLEGWEFEPPSVEMDNYINLLLESNDKGFKYYPGHRISGTGFHNGLCVSNAEGYLLKRDYKYYKVIEKEDPNTKTKNYHLADYSQATIKYENEIFKLVNSEEMLFALRNDAIEELHAPDTSYFMEADLLSYLLKYSKTISANPAQRIREGLYVEDGGNAIFMVHDLKFPVSKYTDKEIYIKRNTHHDRSEDIVLWLDDDTYVRVRDKEISKQEEYTEFSTCRVPRSPGVEAECLPVTIETELHQQLMKYIDEEATSSFPPSPERLTEVEKFDTMVLYADIKTSKYYFHYEGEYFDAKIIDEHDKNNPSGLPALKISGKGNLFTKDKFIANIVIQNKEDRIEIKKMETFLAEKLNVNKKIAEIYLKNRPYRYLSEIGTIEELVDAAQKAGDNYVEMPKKGIGDEGNVLNMASSWEEIKENLFPQRITQDNNYSIKLFNLNSPINELDAYELKSMNHVKEGFKYAKNKILPVVYNCMDLDHSFWQDLLYYSSYIFKNPSIEFNANIARSFGKRLQRSLKALEEDKIILATATHTSDEAAVLENSDSQLTLDEKASGDIAFMSTDDEGKIYINIDKLDLNDPTQLIHAIIQTAFNSKGMTTSYFKIQAKDGLFPPVMDAINGMTKQIESQSMAPTQASKLFDLSARYLKNIPTYDRKINTVLNKDKFAYLARNDSGYLAHLILNSADFLTLLTEDIYYLQSLYQKELSIADPWLQKYKKLRYPADSHPIQSMSTSTIDIAKLTKKQSRDLSISEVGGKVGVFYTNSGLDLLIKSDDEYYPVEFVGKSNRIIFVGAPGEARQAYYYNPSNGEIKPIENDSAFNKQLTYNRALDLYESKDLKTNNISVLKYDGGEERLIDTGGIRIIPMINKVIKLEFADFDIFFPHTASQEVYLAAHGSHLLKLAKKSIPPNVDVHFYTRRGKILHGHMDDIEELVKGTFPVTETVTGGQSLEEYEIRLDEHSQINYHQLTGESARNLIRLKPHVKVKSTDIITAVAKLFPDQKVDLHLYMCRSF